MPEWELRSEPSRSGVPPICPQKPELGARSGLQLHRSLYRPGVEILLRGVDRCSCTQIFVGFDPVGNLLTSVEYGAVVAPAQRVRGGCDLKELVARIPKDTQPEEIDWGQPVGREVW